jgi:hypothetical protein
MEGELWLLGMAGLSANNLTCTWDVFVCREPEGLQSGYSVQQMQMQMQGREAVGIVGYVSRDRHQVTIQTEFLDPTPNALESISIGTMNHRDLAGSLVDINQPTPRSSRRADPRQRSNAIPAFPAILISRRESGLVHVTGSPPICGCFGLVSSRLVMPS